MTSSPLDLLLSMQRGSGRTLGRQLEDQLRALIRDGSLPPGARLPSTRDLAGELGISRPVVVEAYGQLAAEGFLSVRQGARPHVSDCVGPATASRVRREPAAREPRIDLRPGVPDLSAFPRGAWLRATRDALRHMPDAALGYSDPHGALVLRQALGEYLARVRGVDVDPARVVITSGWAQGRSLLLRALRAGGAKRIAIEDPCFVEAWDVVERLGLTRIPVPVDDDGLRVDLLDRLRPDAVIVTPAHQYPSGAVLSGERRAALLEWSRRRDTVLIEDDYDAEYRYDRAPVGALQPLDPERIVYGGTASKTLAPALRLGWLVLPPRLIEPVQAEQRSADFGVPRIEQHAFAEFLARGELDRHLRRMRSTYRARRDALVAAVVRYMPEATVCGIAAGLHAVVRLPKGCDERASVRAAEREGIALNYLGAYEMTRTKRLPALIIGYARSAEPVITAAIKELATLIVPQATRRPSPRPSMRSSFARLALLLVSALAAPTLSAQRPAATASATATATAADLAIKNVTVIDAVNGVRKSRTVLVTNGRIIAVNDAAQAATAKTTVDGTGRFLIPGLWDFHVHLTYDARLTAAMPGLFLNHGITSIRDTGGELGLVTAAVRALRADSAIAPRVFFAGPLMDGASVVYDGTGRPPLGIANPDVAAARANIARLAAAGVDFVKIYEMVTPEVFDVLVTEARARGLPIDGHVPLMMRAREVGPRVQSLEHLRNIEMDCAAQPEKLLAERRQRMLNPEAVSGFTLRSNLHTLQRLAAVAAFDARECAQVLAAMRNTIQVPTLRLNAMGLRSPFTRSDWPVILAKLPADVAAEWRATGERTVQMGAPPRDSTYGEFSLRLVRMMFEAGVPIGAGTDTPIGFAAPGYSLHSEMEMLVRAGLPPMEALRAATLRPAEFFGRAGEMGTIAPGMLADLVLLSADPLVDITNTKRIEAVVTKGRLLDRAALAALVR